MEKDELEGKVLVAKPGKQKEFEEAFNAAVSIAQGKLGWQGQAEMFWEIGAAEAMFGMKDVPKEEAIPKIKELIQNSYMQTIMDFGEWIPKEQAKNRHIANQVLFGDKK